MNLFRESTEEKNSLSTIYVAFNIRSLNVLLSTPVKKVPVYMFPPLHTCDLLISFTQNEWVVDEGGRSQCHRRGRSSLRLVTLRVRFPESVSTGVKDKDQGH